MPLDPDTTSTIGKIALAIVSGTAGSVAKEAYPGAKDALKELLFSKFSLSKGWSRREELDAFLKEQPKEAEAEINQAAAQDKEFAQQLQQFIDQSVTNISVESGAGMRDNYGKVVINLPSAHAPASTPISKPIKISNAPPHNPHFAGREGLLDNLHKRLLKGGTTALTALNGMGGIGKTQVAIEYCHRFRNDYDVIWWIQAEVTTVLSSEFGNLALELKLKDPDIRDERVLYSAVANWLRSTNKHWLIIFDNAEDESQLSTYLGHGEGHVIITSRNPYWGKLGLEVEEMTEEDAVKLLSERTGINDEAGAKQLAKELGYLPLALEQAATYILKRHRTFHEYIAEYRQTGVKLFEHTRAQADSYKKTVVTTWQMSFSAASEKCPDSMGLLLLLSFLAPDDIPVELLGLNKLPNFDEAVDALRDYSLIKHKDGSTISLHRLVQTVTRDSIGEETQRAILATGTQLVDDSFPSNSNEVRKWLECRALLSHALVVCNHCDRLSVNDKHKARLLNQIGLYQNGIAQHKEARLSYKRALVSMEAQLGSSDPNVATILSNLGVLCNEMGDYKEARLYLERALEIDEMVLGREHSNVARELNNLGLVFKELGEYENAKSCFERALAIDEKVHGPLDYRTATDINNLGLIFEEIRDFENAREKFERALYVNQKTLGHNHPRVAANMVNLGSALLSLGDLDRARTLIENAITIDEENLGKNHPEVAFDLTTLARVFVRLGEHTGAISCIERAIEIDKQAFGEKHPNLGVHYCNLSMAQLSAFGHPKEAIKSLELALGIFKENYPANHPRIMLTISNLEFLNRPLDK